MQKPANSNSALRFKNVYMQNNVTVSVIFSLHC